MFSLFVFDEDKVPLAAPCILFIAVADGLDVHVGDAARSTLASVGVVLVADRDLGVGIELRVAAKSGCLVHHIELAGFVDRWVRTSVQNIASTRLCFDDIIHGSIQHFFSPLVFVDDEVFVALCSS